jgi:hypothetical protein
MVRFGTGRDGWVSRGYETEGDVLGVNKGGHGMEMGWVDLEGYPLWAERERRWG